MGQAAAGPTSLCPAVPSCGSPGRLAPSARRPALAAAGRARGYNAAAPGFPAPGPGRRPANPRRGEGWTRPSLAAAAASLRGNHAVVAPAARGARLPRCEPRPRPAARPRFPRRIQHLPNPSPTEGSTFYPMEGSNPSPTETSSPVPQGYPVPFPGIQRPFQEETVEWPEQFLCTSWCPSGNGFMLNRRIGSD